MKTIKTLTIAFLLMFAAVPVFAQTATVRTTLTTATTATSGTETITVASTTGMSASTNSQQNFVLIDGELLRVTAVPSATTLTVNHGDGGVASRHSAGTEVRYGAGGGAWSNNTGNTSGVFLRTGSGPIGGCTRGGNQFLPVFRVNNSGTVTAYDCPLSSTATTGTWISWEYHPGTSEVPARTAPACQAGTTASCIAYTALVSDYYIAITTAFTPDLTTFTVTLPCASVPAGKIWIVGDEGGQVGTGGNGITVTGALLDTQQILVGYTARAYRSNGTSCFRLW